MCVDTWIMESEQNIYLKYFQPEIFTFSFMMKQPFILQVIGTSFYHEEQCINLEEQYVSKLASWTTHFFYSREIQTHSYSISIFFIVWFIDLTCCAKRQVIIKKLKIKGSISNFNFLFCWIIFKMRAIKSPSFFMTSAFLTI